MRCDSNILNPEPQAEVMCMRAAAAIDDVRVRGDSCGGEVTCVVRRCPKGIGAPVFDKLEAELAKALMSLPATKVLALPPAAEILCVTPASSCMEG